MLPVYQTPKIYCLTYKNPDRKQRMLDRFASLDLTCEFIESIDPNTDGPADEILETARRLNTWSGPAWSRMTGQCIILYQFINSDNDLAIVCEDDVLIRKDFAQELPSLVHNFYKHNLDVLLLSYLYNGPHSQVNWGLPALGQTFTYHSYPDELWGAQMYMIRKRHAEWIMSNFGPGTDYADRSLIDPNLTPFSPDWIITKTGVRACVSPMMAVEEGVINDQSADYHVRFHAACRDANYNPDIHI